MSGTVEYVAGRRIKVNGEFKNRGDVIPQDFIDSIPERQVQAMINTGQLALRPVGNSALPLAPGQPCPHCAGTGTYQGPAAFQTPAYAPTKPMAGAPGQAAVPGLTAEQEAELAALDAADEEPEAEEASDPLVGAPEPETAAPARRRRAR